MVRRKSGFSRFDYGGIKVEKLSRAGLLYLKDYNILNEARKDMERFLNEIINQVYKRLKEVKNEFNSSDFKWGVWENKSSKGHLEVSNAAEIEFGGFKKGKANIYIIYDDIRNKSNITNPLTVCISVRSPLALRALKEELKSISNDILSKDIYEPTFVNLDIENSDNSVEEVTASIMEKCKEVNLVIQECLNRIQAGK